ncbi:hypothetical protein SRHO_G00104640 [Serrasalmus rhombeus]
MQPGLTEPGSAPSTPTTEFITGRNGLKPNTAPTSLEATTYPVENPKHCAKENVDQADRGRPTARSQPGDNTITDHKRWRIIAKQVWNPPAPTAAYWL